VERGERHLRGGDQVEGAARVGLHGAEHLLLELGQHRDAGHGLEIHQVRHPQLGEAVLARVQVQHELGERAAQARGRAPHDGEAGLGDLGRAVEVEDTERLADLEVLLRREGERARGAPAAHLDVVVRGGAHRHRGVRHVRDLEQQGLEPPVRLLHLRVEGLDPVGDLPHARGGGLRVLAPTPGLPDRLRGAIALRLELLGLGHEPAAGRVGLQDRGEGDRRPAGGERALHSRGIVADQLDVQHRLGLPARLPCSDRPSPSPRAERVRK
jgi:hypothetical protein